MPNSAFIGSSLGVLAAGGGFLAHSVRGRTSQVFGPSVYRGDRERASIALTFDDGPSESTPALLELLAEHKVTATFFMCGKNVERLPEIARTVLEAGHQIGNHSDTHSYFHFKSPEFIYEELARAQESIRKHTGERPIIFRAPYGVRWFGLRQAQEKLDLTGVMWSILGHDWHWPASRIARLLVGRPRNGDIICLHDGRGIQSAPDVRAMLDAVEVAIPLLKEKGFEFETVSEILCPTN